MFRFLRKKPKTIPPHLKGLADRFLGPIAMATALAEVAGEHGERIRTGSVPFPILDAERAPMVQVWHHLRLEACRGAVRYGAGSLFELADVSKQPDALAELLEHKAHLAFPQPSGSVLAQSVQGMWQAYLYMGEAGTKLADPATDRFQLSSSKRTILSDLELQAAKSQEWWRSLRSGEGEGEVEMPLTLFGMFFNDLNKKTKSIALSKVLGPYQMRELPGFIEEVRLARGDKIAEDVRQLFLIIESSSTPDEAVERTAKLEVARYL